MSKLPPDESKKLEKAIEKNLTFLKHLKPKLESGELKSFTQAAEAQGVTLDPVTQTDVDKFKALIAKNQEAQVKAQGSNKAYSKTGGIFTNPAKAEAQRKQAAVVLERIRGESGGHVKSSTPPSSGSLTS